MGDINRRVTQVNAIQAILAFVEGNDLATASIERVKQNIQNLVRSYNAFTEVHDRLISVPLLPGEFDTHEQLRVEIQRNYDDAHVALQTRANQLKPAEPQPQPAPAQQNDVPPRIQIDGIQHLLAQRQENVWGDFDGTYSKWASFRDLFNATIHENQYLTNAQKFQHLKKSLKGEAKEALGE